MKDEKPLSKIWDEKFEKWNASVVAHAHHTVPYQLVALKKLCILIMFSILS